MRLTEEQRKLAEDNRFLAIHFANNMRVFRNHFDDILSEAFLGLSYAAAKYDPSVGPFSTYATYWMRNYAIRYFRTIPTIRVPEYLWGQQKVRKEDRHHYAEQALRVMEIKPLGGLALLGINSKHKTSTEIVENSDDLAWLSDQIEALDDRAKYVVYRRLAGDTLKTIGDDLGLTRERIRQIELESHESLREAANLQREAVA